MSEMLKVNTTLKKMDLRCEEEKREKMRKGKKMSDRQWNWRQRKEDSERCMDWLWWNSGTVKVLEGTSQNNQAIVPHLQTLGLGTNSERSSVKDGSFLFQFLFVSLIEMPMFSNPPINHFTPIFQHTFSVPLFEVIVIIILIQSTFI